MESLRFDLVVATQGRSELFLDKFHEIKDFDYSRDRVIIFDCGKSEAGELHKIVTFLKKSLNKPEILLFSRRNWNMNHGAQLDYIRLLLAGEIEKPEYVFFMQDHFLNKDVFVKGDTLPEDSLVNLDELRLEFQKENHQV